MLVSLAHKYSAGNDSFFIFVSTLLLEQLLSCVNVVFRLHSVYLFLCEVSWNSEDVGAVQKVFEQGKPRYRSIAWVSLGTFGIVIH